MVKHKMAASLLRMIDEQDEVVVTDQMLNEIFDVPKHIDPLTQLAFSLSGNRQPETQNEILRFWTESNELEYRYNPMSGNHHFRRKMLSEELRKLVYSKD